MLFLLAILSLCLALPSEQSNYKEIIARAQQLSLQQARSEAQQMLLTGIQKEKDLKGRAALITTLKKLSEIFYTDKAQKLYEQGNVLIRQKPAEAMKAFKAVLEIEPKNTKVLTTLGRTYLLLGQCKDSLETSHVLDGLNPFNNENFLLQIQARTCLQDFESLEKDIEEKDVREPAIGLHLNLALAQMHYFKGELGESFKYLQRAEKISEAFPENYYWENQILEKLNKPATESAKKYVKLCKTLARSDWAKFEYEPRMCQEYKSIEAKLEDQAAEKKEGDDQ